MTVRGSIAFFSVMAMALAFGAVARAQDCPRASSPDEARQLAGQAFEQGQRLFEQGNVRGALERFRCSYGLVPHHNTLYNMGECAESLGDLDDAIRYFRTYVETFPDAEARAEVDRRIEALEARRAVSPPPPPPPGGGSGQEPATRMTLARRLAWITLGAGAGLAIIGGGLYGGAVSRNRDFRDQNDVYLADDTLSAEERSDLEDLQSGGPGLEGGGWALMGIGLASMAASLVLFFVFDGTEPASGSARRAPGLSLGPLVLEQGGGLSMAGSF